MGGVSYAKLTSDECHYTCISIDLTDDKSALVQIMACYQQEISDELPEPRLILCHHMASL